MRYRRADIKEANFYQHDQIGTPNLLTSKTGQVKWRGAVDAFGQMVSTISAIDSPLRFAGQYQDNETGYYQNYFRDYNSRTGRYLQSDPIGLAGGFNRFAYVNGRPTRYIDPYGLEGMDWLWGAIHDTTGWEPDQSTVDAAAGFGDGVSSALTFGLYSTADLRDDLGIGSVDECSSAYGWANAAGQIWGGATLLVAGFNGGSNTVFWSGYNQGALTAAQRLGTTLELTHLGRVLNFIHNRMHIRVPQFIWDGASAIFAANARGTVLAVIRNSSMGSTWARIELAILRLRGITPRYVP